ncbi:MAG: general stress protein [Isosphaeraceae bacterium]
MATRTVRRSTVIGVFHDRAHAVAAIKELYQAGFTENQIGIASRRDEGNTTVTEAYDVADHGSTAATGAVTGAVAGASLGGLVGLGVTAGIIPVLGPVIAGGTLAVILANAAGGAAIGAAIGVATGETYPQDQREYYEREFEAGRTIVTVKAGSRSDDAVTILHRNGGYDLATEASRPSTATATRETTVKSATAAGITPNPYPQTPGETPVYQRPNVSADRS